MGDEPAVPGQHARHGINLRRVHGLRAGKRRQDARQTFGEHRFSCARRADQQNIVSARRGNLHGAPRFQLAAHVGKIRHVERPAGRKRRGLYRFNGRFARQMAHGVQRRMHRINAKRPGGRGLGRVFDGDKQALHTLRIALSDDRQAMAMLDQIASEK